MIMLIKRYMLRAACGHHHTAVLICFMHITSVICLIFKHVSYEHKCLVISVFEYFLCLFVLLVYAPVDSIGGGGGGTVSSPNHTFFTSS